jgi:hypothetical protein
MAGCGGSVICLDGGGSRVADVGGGCTPVSGVADRIDRSDSGSGLCGTDDRTFIPGEGWPCTSGGDCVCTTGGDDGRPATSGACA